jgi:DNA-binding response OmpR family regulator
MERRKEMMKTAILTDKGQKKTILAQGKKRRLLVVDDDGGIQELLCRTLSFMGYEVTLAGNGLEAMTLFLANSYDLVITDFQMPFMDGSELSHFIKEKSPKTLVLAITGCCENADLEKLTLNGVDKVILKPFRLKEMERTVQRLLNT